jgi:hypothetical protein
MKKVMFLASPVLALTILSGHMVHAQEEEAPSKIEVGIQFSSLSLGSLPPPGGAILTIERGRTEAGFGGRFTFNLTKHLALEAEGNFFPHESATDPNNAGRLTQGQFGIKAGQRFRNFGIFAKARPGFASFSRVLTIVGTTTIDFNGQPLTLPVFDDRRKTYFSMDLGGVLEFYPSRKVLTRIDVGDTIINYGKGSGFPFSPNPLPSPGVRHNFQLSAGIGFRLGSIEPESTTQAPQEKVQKFEVGAQFSSLGFTEVEHISSTEPFFSAPDFRDTKTQAGFGGRFTFNVSPSFALEAQGDFFPRDSALFNNARAGGRTLQGQAGIKLGKRFEKFGLFGKARPGVVSFSKTLSFDGFDTSQPFPFPIFHLERRTYFSFDLGGVLEFYPSRRIVSRFDGGDTMIRYGSNVLPFPFNPTTTARETIHNFEFSAGVGFRF